MIYFLAGMFVGAAIMEIVILELQRRHELKLWREGQEILKEMEMKYENL